MRIPILSLLLGMAVLTVHADPEVQRDFARLRDDYSKATTAATVPITKRYTEMLGKLIDRANKAGDQLDEHAISEELFLARVGMQGGAALAGFMPGSRWVWYDSGLPGKEPREFWIEFYRDGLAKTSWGSQLTYKVNPPAGVRVVQSNPPQVWFFLVDIAKKEAIADPYASEGHEKRSLRYDRSVPPVAKP